MHIRRAERRGIVVEYGPDQVGYIEDSESSECLGFAFAQLRQCPGPESLKNGVPVVYQTDGAGRVDRIAIDLALLADRLQE